MKEFMSAQKVAPLSVFSVAVRTKEGGTGLFRISHEDIYDHEQVMALVKEEMPEAKVILIGVA